MSWLDNFDPQTISQQMALASISAQQSQLQNQQNRVDAEQKALSSLKTALTDFQSVLKKLNSKGMSGGMVVNSATASEEGYVLLKASSAARKGLYNINVVQTASADQKAFTDLSDEDIANATGTLKITVAGKDVEIDMSDVNNLAELRDKINAESDESGATASLVKKDGKNVLMLSSDKTGATNAVALSASDPMFNQKLADTATVISEARDAEITMGDGEMSFTSSTNTFEDIIPGVEVTVIRKTEPGKPLVISVNNDESGTKEQIQTFVDAYNKLRSKLDELTKSGNSDGSVVRGALAGDSTINALENKLNSLLRTKLNGAQLKDFGLTPDKNGQLELDSEKLEDALKEDPEGLNALFNGEGGLLSLMQKDGIDSFLSVTNGTLKQRQESLDRKTELLSHKESQIELRYESTFNRYLKEFTNMKTIINQMNQTMGQFF